MPSQRNRHSISFLFSFLLLLIFALFALILSGTGALIYQNSISSLNENYTSRTAIAYVSEKLRQNNAAGLISLSCVSDAEGNEITALALSSAPDTEAATRTYIYFYDGSLMELYVRQETTPYASMGTALVELSDFSLEPDGSLLYLTAVSPEGEALSVVLHVL